MGAREVDGVRVAGAAAVLWGPGTRNGEREVVSTHFVALPSVEYAQVAEAWGGRLALLALLRAGGTGFSAQVAGDNLAVVRYGAAEGFLSQPAMAATMAGPLSRCATSAISLTWLAVRRRRKAADQAATKAVFRAAQLHACGQHAPTVWCEQA